MSGSIISRMTLAEDFAANLRAIRLEAGRSQTAQGKALGFTHGYYGRLESGKVNLTFGSVERLAEQLGVPATELVKSPVLDS